ncbi:hypothetical protein K491DRAFT_684231 [Lophiostoma macrostomum CBS 122681]|uniref:RING-type domain-containing protein n=1 Tax=Lophiostoma macrostomum CBS 122681 TaxID=1314788 RepID=A0A6A6SN86_9PLEO|nr:hypothetical protein K491DRAFT_684231 [Lophiostoma macrostomum CBS 122681]
MPSLNNFCRAISAPSENRQVRAMMRKNGCNNVSPQNVRSHRLRNGKYKVRECEQPIFVTPFRESKLEDGRRRCHHVAYTGNIARQCSNVGEHYHSLTVFSFCKEHKRGTGRNLYYPHVVTVQRSPETEQEQSYTYEELFGVDLPDEYVHGEDSVDLKDLTSVELEKGSCGVCLEDHTEMLRLHSCGHSFCCECLQSWLASGRAMGQSCPFCRERMLDDDDKFSIIFRDEGHGEKDARALGA